ncbi:MAG: hypothetical protein ABWZ98_02315 [Nakamurella sp.]
MSAASGFRAELEHSVHASSQTGAPMFDWRSSWRLTWVPVPGAAGYDVFYRTSEGGDHLIRQVDIAELTVEAAAGTSPDARLPADQTAALAITAAQLAVAIAPVTPDGTPGQRSRWFPVGEPLAGDR